MGLTGLKSKYQQAGLVPSGGWGENWLGSRPLLVLGLWTLPLIFKVSNGELTLTLTLTSFRFPLLISCPNFKDSMITGDPAGESKIILSL